MHTRPRTDIHTYENPTQTQHNQITQECPFEPTQRYLNAASDHPQEAPPPRPPPAHMRANFHLGTLDGCRYR